MGAEPELRKQYRTTWEAFSRKLDAYQACVDSGDRARAEAALLEVEKARAEHNIARDCLAERRRVRRTAHLLWEVAGKPNGTAESDWRRAETIMRAASAAV